MNSLNKVDIIRLVIILILLSFVTIKGVIGSWNEIPSDFPNYYLSSKIFIENNDISKLYDDGWFNERLKKDGYESRGKFSSFPPITSLLYIPLTVFKPLTAYRVLVIFNLGLIFFIAYLIKRIIQWKYLNCLLIILLSGKALVYNILLGQFYLILLLLILLAYFFEKEKLNILSSGIWSFCFVVKYFPIVFLFGYFIEKKFSLIKYFTFWTIGFILLQLILFDFEFIKYYFASILGSHFSGNLSMQNPFAYSFQSWNVFLKNLFVFDPIYNLKPFLNNVFLYESSLWILRISTVFIGGYTIYKYKKAFTSNFLEINIAIWGLAGMVLLPVSATYHFLILIFPILILIQLLYDKMPIWKNVLILLLYSSIGFIPYSVFNSIGDNLGIVFCFPRLFIISLLYLISCYFVIIVSTNNITFKRV